MLLTAVAPILTSVTLELDHNDNDNQFGLLTLSDVKDDIPVASSKPVKKNNDINFEALVCLFFIMFSILTFL